MDGRERDPASDGDRDRDSDQRRRKCRHVAGGGDESGRRRGDLRGNGLAGAAQHQSDNRSDHRNPWLHERRQLCGQRNGLGRSADRERELHMDRDQREPGAAGDGDCEPHRCGERHGHARGRRDRSGRRRADLHGGRLAGVAQHQPDDRIHHGDADLHERRHVCGDRHCIGWRVDRECDLHVDRNEREPRACGDGDSESGERRGRRGHARGRRERSGRRRADLHGGRLAGVAQHQPDDWSHHGDADLHERRELRRDGDGV